MDEETLKELISHFDWAVDNLSDLPISDDWAEKWAKKAWEIVNKIPRGEVVAVIPKHTILIPDTPTSIWIKNVCELKGNPVTPENLADALETIATVLGSAPIYPTPEFMLAIETIKRNAEYDD